jgi:hypothetical protein
LPRLRAGTPPCCSRHFGVQARRFVPRNDYSNKSFTTNKAEPVNEKGTFVSEKVLPENWGDSPLKLSLPKNLKAVYITNRISQLVTLIPRTVNFFNYYIAAIQYCLEQHYTAKK